MTSVQQIKASFRMSNDKTLRTMAPGTETLILSHANRLMNGSQELTNSQYTTVTAPYVRKYSVPE